MPNITAIADNIKPDVVTYLDKVQVWLQKPLSKTNLKWLQKQCGQGGLHIDNRPSKFNRKLKQRLQLNQPSTEAIQSLSTKDHHVNYLELSVDWVFQSEQERDQAFEFVSRCHVKKWHGKQEIKFVGTGNVTRYTGPRRAPNVMATYKDRHSKQTGEVNVVHFDWRIRGPALSRLKTTRNEVLFTLHDLNRFEYRQFWQNKLLFYTVKARELGRQYRYRIEGNRGKEWVLFRCNNRFSYDVDKRRGDTIIRLCQQQTQKVVDHYRKRVDLRNCLQQVPVHHLLPENQRKIPMTEGVTESTVRLFA